MYAIGMLAARKRYQITPSDTNVDEGDSVSFTLSTRRVQPGTVLPYTITGITEDDLSSGSLTGEFVVGTLDTVSITLAEDLTTEGAEELVITLDGRNVSAVVTINDTSIDPPSTIVLAMDFAGTDGSQVFTDISGRGHTFTKGTTDASLLKISSDTHVSGTTCGFFWSVGSWLETESSSDFDFGTSDFEIDLHFAEPVSNSIVSLLTVAGLEIAANSSKLSLSSSSIGGTVEISVSMPIGTWHHLNVKRVGSSLISTVNDVVVSTVTVSGSFTSTTCIVGTNTYSGKRYIDDITVTKYA